MNKNELATLVGKKLGSTQAGGINAINAVTEAIVEACKAGEEINLVGFCKFSKVHKEERDCTNPQDPTGDKVHVAAKDVFVAKASKSVDMTPPVRPTGRRR